MFPSTQPRNTFSLASLSAAELLSFSVEELAGGAARFEATFQDPEAKLWAASAECIGTAVEATLDDKEKFKGLIWGRRMVRSSQEGTAVMVWGHDASFTLANVSRHRAFAPGTLQQAVRKICEGAGLKSHLEKKPAGRFASAKAQLVQYGETDFDFLRRAAFILGGDVWPFRGEIWIGEGPNVCETAQLDLADPHVGCTELALDEDWSLEPAGHVFPLKGTPFSEAPRLSGQENLSALPKPASRSKEERTALELLAGNAAQVWPAGLAYITSDQEQFAAAQAAASRDRRRCGVVEIVGALPEHLYLGGRLELALGKETIAKDLLAVGVRHQFEGASRRTWVYFGRAGYRARDGQYRYFEDFRSDLRPAKHVWTAKVIGNYDEKRCGSLTVMPLGWDASSEPLVARISSLSAVLNGGTVHIPQAGELVLLSFENGNPDAPVVREAVFDAEAPPVAKSNEFFVLKTPANGKATLQVDNGKLSLKLKKLELEIDSDKSIKAESKDAIELTSDKDLTLTSKSKNVALVKK